MILVPVRDWLPEPTPVPGAHNQHLSLPRPRVFIHHAAGPEPATPAAEAALVRQYDAQHRAKGWDGLGYSFVVGPSGRVYEGRGQRIGAHTEGHNSEGFGICFLGNFMEKMPAPEAMAAACELIAHLADIGALADFKILGHRDTKATACPGTTLYNNLPQMRDLVSAAQRQITIAKETHMPDTPNYQINRDSDGRLVAGIAAFPDGSYLILGADGGVFPFGPEGSLAAYHGRVHG